jgi:VanZ family protein
MPIKNTWCLACAAVLVLQIFSLGALPFELAEPGNTVWHVLAYAGLAVLLWIATDGRRPLALLLAIMALAFADELRQSLVPGRAAQVLDFFFDAVAACAAGMVLYWKTGAKTSCAESSAR